MKRKDGRSVLLTAQKIIAMQEVDKAARGDHRSTKAIKEHQRTRVRAKLDIIAADHEAPKAAIDRLAEEPPRPPGQSRSLKGRRRTDRKPTWTRPPRSRPRLRRQRTKMAGADLLALYRNDFRTFLHFLRQEAYPGQPFVGGWHLDVMADALMGCLPGGSGRLLLNAPPRSLKSFTASIAWPLYLLGRTPNLAVTAVAGTQELASDFSELPES